MHKPFLIALVAVLSASEAFAIDVDGIKICWKENGVKRCEPAATATVPPEAMATIEIQGLTGKDAEALAKSIQNQLHK